MSDFIEPGSFINARGIDDESVVPLPVAYRVSVIPGLGRPYRVHFPGKFSCVHPDFTPHPLLLISDNDAVGRRPEQRASPAADRMGQKVTRKSERITGNKGVVRGRELILGTQLKAKRTSGFVATANLVAER